MRPRAVFVRQCITKSEGSEYLVEIFSNLELRQEGRKMKRASGWNYIGGRKSRIEFRKKP